MKYLLLLFLIQSCTVAKFERVVDPLEALKLCGQHGVKAYSALSGNITCRKDAHDS